MKSMLVEKFLGGMVGSALGDAIGELAFRLRGKSLSERVDAVETLTYTDDTAMAIGIAESIVESGGLDEKRLGDTFAANYFREPGRGYASGPPTVFSQAAKGIGYSEAAKRLFGGAGSLGNGAAMRIAPIGLLYHGSPDLYEKAELSSIVTHAHPVGIDGAAVLALAVAEAVKADPSSDFPVDEVARKLVEFARTPEIRSKMESVRELVRGGCDPSKAAKELGQSVAVHESMPFAVYAFLQNPRSYEDCLSCAVMHGGDRDTLGAMACGISGAYLGIEAIPAPWRERLENREYIEDLARKLAEIARMHE